MGGRGSAIVVARAIFIIGDPKRSVRSGSTSIEVTASQEYLQVISEYCLLSRVAGNKTFSHNNKANLDEQADFTLSRVLFE